MNDGKKMNRKGRPRKPVNLELTCNVAIPIYLNTMRISFIACSNWFWFHHEVPDRKISIGKQTQSLVRCFLDLKNASICFVASLVTIRVLIIVSILWLIPKGGFVIHPARISNDVSDRTDFSEPCTTVGGRKEWHRVDRDEKITLEMARRAIWKKIEWRIWYCQYRCWQRIDILTSLLIPFYRTK